MKNFHENRYSRQRERERWYFLLIVIYTVCVYTMFSMCGGSTYTHTHMYIRVYVCLRLYLSMRACVYLAYRCHLFPFFKTEKFVFLIPKQKKTEKGRKGKEKVICSKNRLAFRRKHFSVLFLKRKAKLC